MTNDELAEKVFAHMIKCYQMIILAQKRDEDLYDVIYNVAKELTSINIKYTNKLREAAINYKRKLVDPTILRMVKEMDFDNASGDLLEVYRDAMVELIMKETNWSERDALSFWLEGDKYAVKFAKEKFGLKNF